MEYTLNNCPIFRGHLSRTYQGQGGGAFSYPDYADVRKTSRTLTGLMAYDPSALAVTLDNGVDRIEASARFISDLGGHPKAAIKGHLKTGQRK